MMTDPMFEGVRVFFTLAQNEPAQNPNQWGGFLIIMGPLLVVMFLSQMLFGRGESKERARREQMISGLKKNDPVVTIGGILGQVVSVSEDKTEVTIRVDDNTRLKMQAAAIREVVVKDPKANEKSNSAES